MEKKTYSEMLAPVIIKRCHECKGWSFAELARRSGLSKSTLENLLNNVTRNPNIGILNQIAFGLGVPLTTLLEEAGIENLSFEERQSMAKRKLRGKTEVKSK